MTRTVLTVTSDASVAELEDLFTRHHISGLPVVNEAEEAVGMVSKRDVVAALAEVGGQLYNTLTVKTVMRQEVVSCEASAAVSSVAQMMRDQQIHRVVVCDSGKVAGIVTTFDMLTAVIDLG